MRFWMGFNFAKERKVCLNRRTTFCGTYEYLAPEILQGEKYNEKIDIWSLGVLFFEMLNGITPFEVFMIQESHFNQKSLIKNILSFTIKHSSEMTYESLEFGKFMLKTDPKQRPTIVEILNHPFIKNFLNYYYLQSSCPLIINYSLIDKDPYKAICEDRIHQFTSEYEEDNISISEKIKEGIKINKNKFENERINKIQGNYNNVQSKIIDQDKEETKKKFNRILSEKGSEANVTNILNGKNDHLDHIRRMHYELKTPTNKKSLLHVSPAKLFESFSKDGFNKFLLFHNEKNVL